MSPSYFTLHPLALFWQSSPCGLGGPTDPGGPCTGGYGPAGDPSQLASSATSVFGSGQGQIVAIGAAIMALAAVLVLLRIMQRATGRRSKKAAPADKSGSSAGAVDADDDEPTTCAKCGVFGVYSHIAGMPVCEDCFADEIAAACGDDDSAPWDGVCRECGAQCDLDAESCPVCDAGLIESSERQREREKLPSASPVDLDSCSICGGFFPVDELHGELFPACSDCAAAAEAEARRREVDDDGPDSVEDNPHGIGAHDEGIRA